MATISEELLGAARAITGPADVGNTYTSSKGWSATVVSVESIRLPIDASQIEIRLEETEVSAPARFAGLDDLIATEMECAFTDKPSILEARQRLEHLVGAPWEAVRRDIVRNLSHNNVDEDWSLANYRSVLPVVRRLSGAPLSSLLAGAPGTGKSETAEWLPWLVASDIGENVLVVRVGEQVRGSGIQGRAGGIVRTLFDAVRKVSRDENIPCILVVDEADAVLSARSFSDTGSGSQENLAAVNSFLVQLDALSRGDARVHCIFITNMADRLDSAFRRRARRFEFPRLTSDSAIQVIEHQLGQPLAPKVATELASAFASHDPGPTGSDLFQQVLFPAVRRAVEEGRPLEMSWLVTNARDLIPTSPIV